MSRDEKFSRLDADKLKTTVSGAVIGRDIIVLEQISSTNDAISRLASTNGLPSIQEGLVVFAEYQIAGRGQRGSHWESIAGKGLWFSILLRPEIQLSDSGHLTIWAIEAISEVIRSELGLAPVVKLPNDVRLNGQKVAGVLVEMRAQKNGPHLAVVGIGINVNHHRNDFSGDLRQKAISLAIALGRPVNRQQFASALLRYLDASYRQKFSGQGAADECGDVGSQVAQSKLRQPATPATTSAAPPTNPDTRAEKSRRA